MDGHYLRHTWIVPEASGEVEGAMNQADISATPGSNHVSHQRSCDILRWPDVQRPAENWVVEQVMIEGRRPPMSKPKVTFRMGKKLAREFREQPRDPATLLNHEGPFVYQKLPRQSLGTMGHDAHAARPSDERSTHPRHYPPMV